MASRKITVPSGCNCGLTGGAGASGTGAADSAGFAAAWAWAAQAHIEQQSIVAKTKRKKPDSGSKLKGCDISILPVDAGIALHSL
jgi:hypothetical protein